MTADEPLTRAKEALDVLSTIPQDAVLAATGAAEDVIYRRGRFWFWASVILCPALSAGAVWLLLTVWTPVRSGLQGFDVQIERGGGTQTCRRDDNSPSDYPRYLCFRDAQSDPPDLTR